MLVMSHLLRILDIYDTMDHCIYNASKQISVNEPFILMSQNNGLAEQATRPLIVHGFIYMETQKNELCGYYGNVFDDVMDSLDVDELSGFDDETCAGTYRIEYQVPLIASLPEVHLKHQIRIKSIWQKKPPEVIYEGDGDGIDDRDGTSEDENSDKKEDDDEPRLVYTSPHGRREGIYHTRANCHTLKQSWKKPETVEVIDISELESYRECQHCAGSGH